MFYILKHMPSTIRVCSDDQLPYHISETNIKWWRAHMAAKLAPRVVRFDQKCGMAWTDMIFMPNFKWICQFVVQLSCG